MKVTERIQGITKRIIEHSLPSREIYLDRINQATHMPPRSSLSCSNLAHGFSVCSLQEKNAFSENRALNLGIITSYNDMLSAHHPFERFPHIIKEEARKAGGVAQVAGGVPAMCDGITQGQPGMDLSLFSRDVIAMSTAIALSHNMFDAALYLGVCDKIVPGLLIAALSAGRHLPGIFIPAGPMTSGMPNEEKSRIRQLFAEGRADRKQLLDAESRSYHGPGTCTFYGTANSNQMFMEIMGLHMPAASFVNPDTALRDALTREAVRQALLLARDPQKKSIGLMIDERSFVNAIVGLHATGGSTNHTIHLVAMASAAGICISWQDIAELSEVVPLLTRIYPNGNADINRFNTAGGTGFLIRELLDAGLLHEDVTTICGNGLRDYTVEAKMDAQGKLFREPAPKTSRDENVLAPVPQAFRKTGGLKLLTGNIGQAIIKTSSLKPQHLFVEAPAIVLESQVALETLFESGFLERDFVAVIRFQGPRANGMPELHKLTTVLGVLQDRGFKVALVTDGRMSGASGRIPAAIHLTPEACEQGLLARLKDDDIIRIDTHKGRLEALVPATELASRSPAVIDLSKNNYGSGRELFTTLRNIVSPANFGASIFRP